MTLSPLSTALVHICSVRNDNRRSLDALKALDKPTPEDERQIEFWHGRVAGLSQALDILRVIGEQPVGAANYIAEVRDAVGSGASAPSGPPTEGSTAMNFDRNSIAGWERDLFHRQVAEDIAGLPETDEPTVTEVPDERVTLLERTYAGLSVEIVLLDSERIALRVVEGEGKPILQPIQGEDAFDAFNHPYCYIPR